VCVGFQYFVVEKYSEIATVRPGRNKKDENTGCRCLLGVR
jgi:hypothetical protein